MAAATDNDTDPADELAPSPRANPELIGHAVAERLFLDAAVADRLAGAWLITGPEGIGKATLAFRLARFLLAGDTDQDLFSAPENLAVDGADPVFHRVAAEGHSDLLTIERMPNPRTGKLRSEIIVDDVRRLTPFFRTSAGEGGWRIVVIDGAELMNLSAANAALKMIEEPPAQAMVLLVSHAPARLLPTIRSRCRTVPVKSLKPEQVVLLLERYRPDLDSADLLPLARLADGSPGRALRLAELGGLGLYRDLLGLLGQLPKPSALDVHGLAERLGRPANDLAFRTTLDLLRWWLTNLVRYGAESASSPAVPDDERELMARLTTARRGLERWVNVWEKVGRLQERAISVNLDRKQVVLSTFAAMEDAARS